MLIDSHCHLDRLNLKHYAEQLDHAVEAALESGVAAMLCVCISSENKDRVIEIAETYPQIVASVGVHPSDIKSFVETVDTLKAWANNPRVVAIGETGLDYYYSEEFAGFQKQSFINHLIAAGDLAMPTIVHTRNAKTDTLALIREYGNLDSSGVLHCFTEDWDMARQAIDMNYCISISGIVTFRNAEALRDVVRKVPLDRLLIETDSPYLAPVPYRGKSNEPKFVKAVAEYVAELKGVSYEHLLEVTASNFFSLFPKAEQALNVSSKA